MKKCWGQASRGGTSAKNRKAGGQTATFHNSHPATTERRNHSNCARKGSQSLDTLVNLSAIVSNDFTMQVLMGCFPLRKSCRV